MERYGKYASFKTDSKNSKIIFMLFTFFLQSCQTYCQGSTGQRKKSSNIAQVASRYCIPFSLLQGLGLTIPASLQLLCLDFRFKLNFALIFFFFIKKTCTQFNNRMNAVPAYCSLKNSPSNTTIIEYQINEDNGIVSNHFHFRLVPVT